MAWVVLNSAKVVEDTETHQLGIQCGCGGDVVTVGNNWQDVTNDFTFDERLVPLSCAVVAGNRVLHMTATLQLTELINEEIHLFDNTKWHSLIDSTFPIMVVHTGGTVMMIDGTHWPAGYVTADLTGVATTDLVYINITVPCE